MVLSVSSFDEYRMGIALLKSTSTTKVMKAQRMMRGTGSAGNTTSMLM
jgi:hypothetical protein